MSALEVLKAAKHKLETAGWWRGDFGGREDAFVPVAPQVMRGDCACLATAVRHDDQAGAYIMSTLGDVSDWIGVYVANDMQPATEEGRLWAVSIIDKAIALAEADMRIDLARARELLPQAVATQGPDFVYAPDGQTCWYRPQPHLSDDDPRQRTGCLIGVVFQLAGLSVTDAWEMRNPNTLRWSWNFEHQPQYLTEAAAQYLTRAQTIQDGGASWGEALREAELWAEGDNGQTDDE